MASIDFKYDPGQRLYAVERKINIWVKTRTFRPDEVIIATKKDDDGNTHMIKQYVAGKNSGTNIAVYDEDDLFTTPEEALTVCINRNRNMEKTLREEMEKTLQKHISEIDGYIELQERELKELAEAEDFSEEAE